MRYTLAAASIALLIGCKTHPPSQGPQTITYEIDVYGVPAARQALIAKAADAWRPYARKRVLELRAHGTWYVVASPCGAKYSGLTHGDRHLVRIDPALSDADFYGVAVHEMGHVLGLGHTYYGVMCSPEVGGECDERHTQPSGLDIVECRRVGSCE
jgi:hypothetical protein